jgi:ABC-type Na+ efflux pump permease subunit
LTKAFIIATFVIPLVVWGALGAAGVLGLFSSTVRPVEGVVAVLDETADGQVFAEIQRQFDPEFMQQDREARLEQAKAAIRDRFGDSLPENFEQQLESSSAFLVGPEMLVTVEQIEPGSDLDAARERVRSGDLLGFVRVDAASLVPPGEFEVFVGMDARRQDTEAIEDTVSDAIISERFRAADIDKGVVESLFNRPRARSVTIAESGTETSAGNEAQTIVPLAYIMLLLIAILTAASYLLMSTVEEKTSRVMEVLLSAVSPLELMMGKILGQGFVGIVVFLVYGALGLFAASTFNVLDLITPGTLVLLVVYFLLGYFLFAAIMAAIGSAVTEIREAQALQGPVLMVTILFVYLAVFAAMNDPGAPLARFASFVPLATPFVMPMRLGDPAAAPPAWEIAATIAVSAVSVAVATWAAAKIFRIGVLMYGKPPSLGGLLKWIRQAG